MKWLDSVRGRARSGSGRAGRGAEPAMAAVGAVDVGCGDDPAVDKLGVVVRGPCSADGTEQAERRRRDGLGPHELTPDGVARAAPRGGRGVPPGTPRADTRCRSGRDVGRLVHRALLARVRFRRCRTGGCGVRPRIGWRVVLFPGLIPARSRLRAPRRVARPPQDMRTHQSIGERLRGLHGAVTGAIQWPPARPGVPIGQGWPVREHSSRPRPARYLGRPHGWQE